MTALGQSVAVQRRSRPGAGVTGAAGGTADPPAVRPVRHRAGHRRRPARAHGAAAGAKRPDERFLWRRHPGAGRGSRSVREGSRVHVVQVRREEWWLEPEEFERAVREMFEGAGVRVMYAGTEMIEYENGVFPRVEIRGRLDGPPSARLMDLWPDSEPEPREDNIDIGFSITSGEGDRFLDAVFARAFGDRWPGNPSWYTFETTTGWRVMVAAVFEGRVGRDFSGMDGADGERGRRRANGSLRDSGNLRVL